MVEDVAGICRLCDLKFQFLPLKFVPRDVVFQDRAFFPADNHFGYYLFCQEKIVFQYGNLIVEPVKVKIFPGQKEKDFLTVHLQVQVCHFLFDSGDLDACVNGSSGIDDLGRFQGEIVSPTRNFNFRRISEVPVP